MKQFKALTQGIVLPGQQRMTGGRSLNGGVWLDIEGKGRIELAPDQAFQMARGIFEAIGVNLEFSDDATLKS